MGSYVSWVRGTTLDPSLPFNHSFLMFFLISAVLAGDPRYDGNCLTQRINFTDPSRTFALDGMDAMRDISELDTSRYDMTIDYFTKQVRHLPGGGVELTISDNGGVGNPDAPRMSTTRFMLYGKVTAVLKAPAVPGVVTTFITMGPNLPDAELDLSKTDKQGGDEIDWEIVGGDPKNAQSNIFYRGFKEYAVRGGIHKVDTGITQKHKYTIDWRRESIIFSLDDKVQRTYLKNSTEANSTESKTRRFFPDRAQKVQFAVWSDSKNEWAGGAPKWPAGQKSASAVFDYIDIQCYNDKDQPVPKWPIDNNPDWRATIKNQPVRGINGKIPNTAAPGFTGEIGFNGLSGSAMSSSILLGYLFSFLALLFSVF